MSKKLKNISFPIQKPLIMGILNVTPDSFYDGGKFFSIEKALDQVNKMQNEGADIIDIGAFSSKPNANEISIEEEKKRIIPVVKEIIKSFPNLYLSVDTYRTKIAEACVNLGVKMINDIYGGRYDKSMIKFITDNKIPYVLMHMRGNPKTMQKNINYDSFKQDIIEFFNKKNEEFIKLGHEKLIIDPGFGFGKTIEQNYKLINMIPDLKKINKNILIGLSRKSMIYKVLNSNAENSLNSTSILNTICLKYGAKILRVHDVKEAKEVIKMINLVEDNK